ncbi:MAG: gamma carbonic anhydrase family protein [Deltaproteobacteria bacterium]|nr:gamma carbonic anhydrase family protein [Deltaproteobacteria bacterium]
MIIPFNKVSPRIHPGVFIAPQAVVVGDVEIGEGSSIWFQTVVRGDVNSIRIGKRTNIQDLSVVHVSNADGPKPAKTVIGDDVTVGHRVILHGCTIGNACLIGMGSIIMDDVVVGEGSFIGAGSLVTEGIVIPPGQLALGRPAKVIRPLTDKERAMIPYLSNHYARLAESYLKQGIR